MNDSSPAHAPDAELLGRLLQTLGIAVSAETLTHAVLQTQAAFVPTRLVEWVRAVLALAHARGVQPAQLAWRRFDKQRLPVLIWHAGQWYMATAVDAQGVTLQDSQGQTHSCPHEDLQDALLLWLRVREMGQATDSTGQGNRALKLVLKEIFRHPGWIMKVVIATVVVNLIAVATSLFSMQVYDRVVPTLAYATLTTLVAGMALIVVLDWVLKMLRSRILDSLSCAVDKRISQQVFDHLLYLQLDLQPTSVGSLAAQVTGLDSVRQFFSSTVIFGLVDLPFALMFMAFMAMIGGQVAMVYALMLPVALLVGWITQRRLKELVHKQVMRSNERQGVLVDAIRGAEAIRAANAGWRFSKDWKAITASIDAYNIQQKATNSFLSVTMGSLSTIAYTAAIVVGVWQVEAGHVSMGAMVACSILGGRVIGPISQGVQYLAQWQQVSQSLQMVNRVLQIDLDRRPGQTLISPTVDKADLTFAMDKVRYGYPQSPIQQVNLTEPLEFKAGERVLLVGPVGCGKSTLLKLMAGLYRPREGRVLLSGADVWEMDPQVVSNYVGYLPQGVHLFKGTLRSNLTLSGVAGDAQINQIVKELGIDAIAAGNPLGMDLPISEGGDGLSGGQRQVVALARVMVSEPRIWLLDEPTASLDAESEAQVWSALQKYVGEHDILVVSTHKPVQALAMATRVLVMRSGEVVKDGAPAELFPKMFTRPATSPLAVAAPAAMPNVAPNAGRWGRPGEFNVI